MSSFFIMRMEINLYSFERYPLLLKFRIWILEFEFWILQFKIMILHYIMGMFLNGGESMGF